MSKQRIIHKLLEQKYKKSRGFKIVDDNLFYWWGDKSSFDVIDIRAIYASTDCSSELCEILSRLNNNFCRTLNIFVKRAKINGEKFDANGETANILWYKNALCDNGALIGRAIKKFKKEHK